MECLKGSEMRKYEAKHNDITVMVNDNSDIEYQGTISAMTQNGSCAELSDLGKGIEVKGLNNPVYYFNRIKAQRGREGTGEGKALMIEICKVADEKGISILNELNPYGNRDEKSLIEFFKESGFEMFSEQASVMVRKPKRPV